MCFLWYKQQFLHSDWLKTCQLIPNQWNFTSAKLNHILYHNVKCNETNDERNLRQDLLTIENTDLDTKVHALYYANELLVRVRLSFKNFCKLAQHAQAIRKQKKNAWEKSDDAYSFSTIFRFLRFYVFTTISTSKKCFYFNARAKKGIARHIDASSVFVIFGRSEHEHASYPELSFRPPGFGPYRGGKKREFSFQCPFY